MKQVGFISLVKQDKGETRYEPVSVQSAMLRRSLKRYKDANSFI